MTGLRITPTLLVIIRERTRPDLSISETCKEALTFAADSKVRARVP